MSSYLNIYLKDKESDKNKLLCSFSRSSGIYRAFDESINITFIGSGEEEQYTNLSLDDFNMVLSSLREDREKFAKRLTEVERYAKDNAELIDEILSTKECIEETTTVITEIEFLKDILNNCLDGCNSFTAVCANID